ncbi:efflux RND transporter periplasmic adaptor subunit [Paracoccus sp. CPCC 101403]|uniref:Efflux RND transporter periplasmic adaptor subunit n=1 Tax=Paracoccus broussonetiae TaxID=3075834 RepID=A0ABU3E9V7_9RHOB|nr:efflux RND transporter periplasmic adaptor subunit [Paracoccus sp. CPCC 101403]MDT1060925.1 efflux RND transporter periplasmic adaptor subunit [Paracoccus sp. CPCC 101403]
MRRYATLALVVAVLLVGGIALRSAGLTPGNAATATYLTAPVLRGDVEVTVMAEGQLKPEKLVAVGAQVSGRITSLAVTLGQQVKAGDLIAEIDSVTQENALRTAQATLANYQAQKDQQQAVLALAEKTLARQDKLLKSNTTAHSDYDSAEEAVSVATAQIAGLDAQIAGAQVAIETAQANLGYTRITAPSDGTVLAVVNQAGQTVNAVQSSPTIVVLGQLDRMNVHAEISEADISRVAVGQKVRFHLLGDTGRSYDSVLQEIAPAPESIVNDSAIDPDSASSSSSEAVYYTGIIPVENPDGALRTYMTAQVSIILGEARDTLTIPSAALGTPSQDGRYPVRVLASDGKVETREIGIGLNDKVVAQVVEGLDEGEQVVTGEATQASATTGNTGGMMGPPPLGG